MSTDTVIKVENLSKKYRFGAREGHKTFLETLTDAAKVLFIPLSAVLRRAQNVEGQTLCAMPCALCVHCYAPGSMPHAVVMKAINDWRKNKFVRNG